SPFGAVIEAIRENVARARACGYNVTLTRLVTFVISGGFCGLAGALEALHLSIVPIESMDIQTSGLAVMMCLFGGMGTYFGPFVAGTSTYFTLISVALMPTTARIAFEARDITGMAQHRFAHIGIAQSFQLTNVFPQLTTLETVRVALQALVSRFNVWRPRVG